MLALLALVPIVLGAQQCPSMIGGEVAPALACFIDHTPPCAEDRRHCVGIHVHLVVERSGPVQRPEWLTEQLEHAHLVFAPIGVGFEIVDVDAVDPSFVEVATREERDAIGRAVFSRGVVHVFVVGKLGDVDIAGEQIRGVHWRQRSQTEKRWIILSRIASKTVLAHELGHFFGLPHSTYPRSIMNKAPREQPPWEERVFVDEELAIVRTWRDDMLRDGSLAPRQSRKLQGDPP